MEDNNTHMVTPEEGREFELINEALKDLNYYKFCNKTNGDECECWLCAYATLWFGETFRVICGRRDIDDNH